jgi:hypothetical protein
MNEEDNNDSNEEEVAFINEEDIETSIVVDNTEGVNVVSDEVNELQLQDTEEQPHNNESNEQDQSEFEKEDNRNIKDDSAFQFTNHTGYFLSLSLSLSLSRSFIHLSNCFQRRLI